MHPEILRRQGIYYSLQTLPGGYRVTLAGREPVWGAGDTPERALEAALKEYARRYGKRPETTNAADNHG